MIQLSECCAVMSCRGGGRVLSAGDVQCSLSSWWRRSHDNCEIRTHARGQVHWWQCVLRFHHKTGRSNHRLLCRCAGLRRQNLLWKNSVRHLCSEPWPPQYQTVCLPVDYVLWGSLQLRCGWVLPAGVFHKLVTFACQQPSEQEVVFWILTWLIKLDGWQLFDCSATRTARREIHTLVWQLNCYNLGLLQHNQE